MVAIKSLLTVLSPTDSLSNCSVTTVCNPVLDSTPVLIVSLSVSSIVVVLSVLIVLAGFPKPSLKLLIHPPAFLTLEVDCVDLTVVSLNSNPVQLVSHAFHTIGAKPVCGSRPSVCSRRAIVDE